MKSKQISNKLCDLTNNIVELRRRHCSATSLTVVMYQTKSVHPH